MGVEVPINGALGVMRFTVSGDPEFMHVTLGFIASDAETDPITLADRWNEAIIDSAGFDAADMLGAYSRQTSLVHVRLPSGFVTVEVGTAISGSASGVAPPNNCAILVRKVTALGGRRNRGRMYFPPFGMAETEVDATGVITSGYRGVLTAVMTGWYNALGTNGLEPMLWHSDGSLGAPIESFAVQPRIATQRTRMRR